VDPEGMFLGEWHARNLCVTDGEEGRAEVVRERKARTSRLGRTWGDGVLWEGALSVAASKGEEDGGAKMGRVVALDDGGDGEGEGEGERNETPSPGATVTSEESFDYLAKGEASVYVSKEDE
jgi:D-arabinono-1,4-lactone oxidase